jgi:Tol biopolymer transport system component
VLSADGRFVAFVAEGGISVRDRQSGRTGIVSVNPRGEPVSGEFWTGPAISADGRFVAFQSTAANLLSGDTNEAADIFVRDRETGTTECVSVSSTGAPANEWSESSSVSADGRFVAFTSGASNLVPGDTNDTGDVFVRDRQTGTTELVSVSTDGARTDNQSAYPSLSPDGRFVAFWSEASNLVPGDTNNSRDVFVRDRLSGITELVTVSLNGTPAGGAAWEAPAVSVDGRFVAFQSDATNLVPGDTNQSPDIFVRDRQTGRTEIISVSATGEPAGGYAATLSADGRFVAFLSWAENLAPEDPEDWSPLYVRDRQTGQTAPVVIPGDEPGRVSANSPLFISADGRFVAFTRYVAWTIGGRADERVLVADRFAETTEVIAPIANVSRTPLDSGEPAISTDGQWVAYVTGGQVFALNRVTGEAELVSANARGVPANSWSFSPAISANGRFVAFGSWASDLAPGITTDAPNLFLRDRQTGKTEWVGPRLNFWCAFGIVIYVPPPAISADGRFVAYACEASDLVPGITNGGEEILLWDRQSRKTELVSVTPSGDSADGISFAPSISADGRFVAFMSWAENLVPGDTNGQADIFVRDRQTGQTERVSAAADAAPANGYSYSPSISGDSRFVAFVSEATNLAPGDTNEAPDIFVRDRLSGKTEPLSVAADGGPAQGGGSPTDRAPAISSDGRFVAFVSSAANLVAGATGGADQVYVRDRLTRTTERIARGGSGAVSGKGGSPAISGDGRFVAFGSEADDVVPGDTNGRRDVFVAERG